MEKPGRKITPEVAAERIRADPTYRGVIQRRILLVVIAGQVLAGTGLAAGITVGALLAQDIFGGDSLTGMPAALFTSGSAFTAFVLGRAIQIRGRRLGLGAGFTVGAMGAFGVVLAATTENLPLLFISLFIYGAGSATNLQARYSGTDLATPKQRGTATAVALVSTTIGAVAGPNLVSPLGALVEKFGIPPLAGPFALAGVAYLAAGTVLLVWLRPDPFLTSKLLEPAENATPVGKQRLHRGVIVGTAVMVVTQITMLALMSLTPVHMRALGFPMEAVGLVIGIHIAAMYLPSVITGPLVDRVGRIPMAIAAGVTLFFSGVAGAFGTTLTMLIIALTLLGVGWNFGLLAGSAMIVDYTKVRDRARIQGSVDVLIALSGAVGTMLSGFLLAAGSFKALALGGAVFSLVYIPLLLWLRGSEPLKDLDAQ